MISTLRKSLMRCIAAVVVFALLSFASPHAEAAGVFVQPAQNHSATAAPISANTITVTAGHTLVVWIVSLNAGPQTVTGGCTYSFAGTTASVGGEFLSAYYCQNATGGSTTVSSSDTGVFAIYVAEYSGLATSGGLAGTFVSSGAQAAPGTTPNILTSGATPLNVTTAPATMFAFVGDMAGIGSTTANTGTITAGTTLAWNSRTTGWVDNTGGTIMTALAEDLDTAATGNKTATASLTGNKQFATFVTAAFALPDLANGAVLAGAATDTISATGALTAGAAAPFAAILLDNASHVGGSDNVGMGSGPGTGTGDSAQVAFTKLKQWGADANAMFGQLYPIRDLHTGIGSGFTVAVALGVTQLVLNPAGTLAAGTVTLPKSPADEQPFTMMSSQTVTALTTNTSDGTTINGAATTIAANTSVKYRFMLSLNTWFRE